MDPNQQSPITNNPQSPSPINPPLTTPLTSEPIPPTPNSLPPTKPKSKFSLSKTKKLIIIAVLAVLLLSGGFVFGYYLPNKPENIWKKSLSNTAKGYDKLVDYGQERKDIKGGKITGNFKYDSNDMVVDGNIDSKFYGRDSITKLDIGAAGTRINAEMLTKVSANSKNPDIYLKVNGLKVVDSLAGMGLAAYDDQWYVLDHTMLDQLEKESTGASAESTPEITSDDIVAIAEVVGKVNREYLLNTEPNKAVFTVKENVGKETVDGRKVYHYKVGYDKTNLKAYATKLKDELKQTKIKEFYKDQDFEKAIDFEGMIKAIDELDGNGQADVWIDTKTKLIRTVRFTDSNSKDNYIDVGLSYNGGDEYPFYIGFNAKEEGSEGKGTLKLIVNTKTNTIKLEGNMEGTENNQPLKFSLNALLEQNNDQINVEVPAGAKSLVEVFSSLLGSFYGATTPAAGSATTSPDLMQSCLTAYEQYAATGDISVIPAECAQ